MGIEVPQNGFQKKGFYGLKISKPEALKNGFSSCLRNSPLTMISGLKLSQLFIIESPRAQVLEILKFYK